MDNGGIRKRKDAKENKVNIQGGMNFPTNEGVANNGNWNSGNSISRGKNEHWDLRRNALGLSSNIGSSARRDSSSDNSKSGKKKSLGIFNSSNISAISNNCMKSFNNMLNNINYNINSSVGHGTGGGNHFSDKSGAQGETNFYENQFKNLNLAKGISYLSNIANPQQKFTSDNRNVGGNQSNFNFFRNYENNLAQKRENNTSGTNQYSNSSQGKYANASGANMTKSTNKGTVNSENLESFLNDKEIQNPNYNITGFGNIYISEINNLRNINNDETYCTCLDNLLRNHGNIDSNEMLKYNDKNINCLNDIIFLDVYRAYNVLTYMQEKVNIIIYTIKIIGKKLKKKHVPEEVVISLEFLNFCVKNLGLFFVRFLDEGFMKKISALLKTTTLKKSITKDVKSKLSKFLIVPIIHPGVATDPRLHFIKRKILFMLQLWHDSFILHQHIAVSVFDEYKSLKEKGITFPIINKAEKFYVKNADTSPSFSDDNILHDLPLKLAQINNMMKSLKEIKHMHNDEEKSKCIAIVAKYKDLVLQSINKLSDYKGNINISVTLNSLLYINDQICIFEKWEKERGNGDGSESALKSTKKEERTEEEKEKLKQKGKKKKNKKKETLSQSNINEIIFNKYDPWNTEKKEGKNEAEQEKDIFFNESVGSFASATSANFMSKQATIPFNSKNGAPCNSENVFSFFGDESIEPEVITSPKKDNPVEDKYSVFNELNFSNDSAHHLSNNFQQGLGNLNVTSETTAQKPWNPLPPSVHIAQQMLNSPNKQTTQNNNFDSDKSRNNLLPKGEGQNSNIHSETANSLSPHGYNSPLRRNDTGEAVPIPGKRTPSTHIHILTSEPEEENFKVGVTDDIFNLTQIEISNQSYLSGKSKNRDGACTGDSLPDDANATADNVQNGTVVTSTHISVLPSPNNSQKGENKVNVSKDNAPHFNGINFDNIIDSAEISQNALKKNEQKTIGQSNITKEETVTNENGNEANYDYLFETFDFDPSDNKVAGANVQMNASGVVEEQSNLKKTSECNPPDIGSNRENEKTNIKNVCDTQIGNLYGGTSDMTFDQVKREATSMNTKHNPLSLNTVNKEDLYSHLNHLTPISSESDESLSRDEISSDKHKCNSDSPNNTSNMEEEISKKGFQNDGSVDQCEKEGFEGKHPVNTPISEENVNEKDKKEDTPEEAVSNSDSNDINFDEIDEITKAIDDLNDNFENMNIYKFDN
ncbi:conserved Plasmodium protein, unknown function [Plasmodium knowlesi strain H]|uniref:VHS domain-containing protein n=3 Tax=Plasmodium knowlesi TaxID=5850 RepID=A0A5K1U0F0_PLAKH|nr:TOM1-like protein, putative [Plasmodium knowlesi strain H]OTN63814.1 Uncharacterized protein PKNOH_S140225100 [Plasmodium knowlesi]CAA9990679.1 TOM1-like protein, putative [Plasmodium knowlesi strain H]SBO25935.1 conserved Plasmodium protein, unknown function [Plasmodium knowlesi strain H]SBO28679.1 conserved Plasmodium protein, unknown function [Plasmodium knowlesi strain H]VVS80153.1 TOM1-like protein, putative [Plasmodium knowlesi strain H]|eukprot:XP_002261970.1 hypothetical protein, conserved in Plasmodium species [Plasmodium knowlesi strain H]